MTMPAAFVALLLVPLFATAARAQTDYYNTSTGRPLRIEDASPIEYRGVELDLAPVRWERSRDARTRWSLHPEIAVGVFPRTQLQIGVPLARIDEGASAATGVSGLEISAMHALNAETSIPAVALAAEVLLPVGALGSEATYGSLKAIMTRTLTVARIHANAQVTLGPTVRDLEVSAGGVDASRWLAGIAIDRTFPLRSFLLSLESFVEQPIHDGATLEWNAGAGARVQLAPRWAIDGGFGRRLTGADRVWYVTFGSAYALGLPW